MYNKLYALFYDLSIRSLLRRMIRCYIPVATALALYSFYFLCCFTKFDFHLPIAIAGSAHSNIMLPLVMKNNVTRKRDRGRRRSLLVSK